MTYQLKEGLKPTPKDSRDFPLGSLVKLPALEELDPYFILKTLSVKDQGDSDFCSGFASCTVSEPQEGVELSPEYSFALSKELSGDPDEWGQDLRTALKAHVKVGALEQREAPFSLKNKDQDFLRRIENWPELKHKASLHKKKSFVAISGPYDHFDNIKASMWKFKEEKRGVVVGLIWSWDITERILSDTSNQGFGHAMAIIGWSRDALIIQNSAGTRAGDEGKHYITRETINHFVEMYGAYMMIDMPPEELRDYLENGIKIGDNPLIKFIKRIFKSISKLWQN